MDPNIEAIHLCFQVNETMLINFVNIFQLSIQCQQSHSNLNSRNTNSKFMRARNLKCLKFSTITTPFIQFDRACHCSSPKAQVVYLQFRETQILKKIKNNII